jgi:hypothetical protein
LRLSFSSFCSVLSSLIFNSRSASSASEYNRSDA